MTAAPMQILVVDGDPGDAARTCARLATADVGPVRTAVATSLAAASAALRAADFDLTLVDLDLPDSAGLATLAQLKALRPVGTFVVLAGAVDEPLRAAALGAGAEAVIGKDEAGSRLFALSVLYVVERRRADHERRRLEKLMAVSADAFVVVGAAGTIEYVNDAALELFGRSRTELTGETLTFAAQEGVPVELRIPRAGDERVGEMRVVNFEWQGARATLATIRDVTEQKRLETQLALFDRMVAIGTLAAGVAHEINNPLLAVIANLDVALEGLAPRGGAAGPAPELLEPLRDAREAAHRVRDIVRDLKILSRPDEDQRGPVDVHGVLESTVQMAFNEIRHRARLIKRATASDLPLVDANQSRLGQVFLNLLLNAAQAIPAGDVDGNEIVITTGLDAAGRVTVEIADTGPGIPPAIQRRLFTPFFTTKPVGSGTGLGLAICQRIVTSFGGEITFASEVGRGTTFQVALPAVAAPPPAPAAAPAPGPSPARPRARILVIDDDLRIVRVIKRGLATEHDVTSCDRAGDALALLLAGAAFDIVLCDVLMPQMTGDEFYQRVKAHGLGLEDRIVFMTGGTFTPHSQAFIDSVPNLCINKPFDIATLRALVRDRVR